MTAVSTPDRRRWAVLAVLCLSLFMVVVANTVLNVALPTLQRDPGATNTQLQWIVTSYALVFAGFLLTGGALGDRYGRKGMLTIGLAVFGLASGLSTLATSADQLIATRALMGLAAALVMPATLSILTTVFAPAERARAIGIWAGVAGAGAAVGPIAGGLLLKHFWWGSVFLLNVPIVVTALVAGRLLVPTSRDPEQPPLDLVGAAASIGALGSLLYGIIEAGVPGMGWTDPRIIAAFVLAAALVALFVVWELQAAHPMLDLRFFRQRGFSGGSAAITLVFFVLFGTFYLLTQYLQLVKGYSALEAGVRTLPMAFTLMVVAPASARLVERFDTRRVVVSGLMIVAGGMALLSRVSVDSSYVFLAVCFVVLAAGMGCTMAPSTTSIMRSVPMGKAGVGSAVNDTTRELGGALGVAVLGSLFASHYQAALAKTATAVPGPVGAAARGSLGAALKVAKELGGTAGAGLADAARYAYVDGMRAALVVAAVVALAAAAAVGAIMAGDRETPTADYPALDGEATGGADDGQGQVETTPELAVP